MKAHISHKALRRRQGGGDDGVHAMIWLAHHVAGANHSTASRVPHPSSRAHGVHACTPRYAPWCVWALDVSIYPWIHSIVDIQHVYHGYAVYPWISMDISAYPWISMDISASHDPDASASHGHDKNIHEVSPLTAMAVATYRGDSHRPVHAGRLMPVDSSRLICWVESLICWADLLGRIADLLG